MHTIIFCFPTTDYPNVRLTKFIPKDYVQITIVKMKLQRRISFVIKPPAYATTRLLAERLNIPKERYTVCFQSRLDKKWLEPFSDKVVEECARKGMKKILVFSPAFTADCLETIIEIGDEYQEIFKEHGGEKVQLVESLNDHPLWIKCLKELVLAN